MSELTFEDLEREVEAVIERNPRLLEDQAFTAWFLQASIGGDETSAIRALPGRMGEKGVDGVYLDVDRKQVVIVQGKFHRSIMRSQEQRSHLLGFADLATVMLGSNDTFKAFCGQPNPIEPAAKEKLKKARDHLRRGYELRLCFVSTGRCSAALEQEAIRKVRRILRLHKSEGRFQFFDGNRVLGLLYEWLDGASPPIPEMSVPLALDPVQWKDDKSGVRMWAVWMNGKTVADMFDQAHVRLFHRNVRGYLGFGDNAINQAMMETIEDRPQLFIYLNNGITIICDSADRQDHHGEPYLSVFNPQIINGQQTTRVLYEAKDQARKTNVLVRVIELPTKMKIRGADYEEIVSEIVEATNRQNAIKSTDLRANDRLQVQLEREFAKLNYFYVRKRQIPSEIRPLISQSDWVLKKEDVARAVGACLEEGLPRRQGIDKLFRDDLPYYKRIFRSKQPYFYLTRWWLWRVVSSVARGSSERQWAKYVVTFFLWRELAESIRRSDHAFIKACENPKKYLETDRSLRQLADILFQSAHRYYEKNRGRGVNRVEVSPLFKRRDVLDGFESFWRSHENTARRSRFRKSKRSFELALKA